MDKLESVWDGTQKDAMRIFLENAISGGIFAKLTVEEIVSCVLPELVAIAEEAMPLERIRKESDIILRAEGPGADHRLPFLSAFNWLTKTANDRVRAFIRNALELFNETDSKRIAHEADLRLSGVAPGSIYIGLKLMLPEKSLLPPDSELGKRLLETTCRLPLLARCIGDEKILPDIQDVEPDPAMRDAYLESLFAFAPSGKHDIHTLTISSKGHGVARLSQRERVVLRNALIQPQTKHSMDGEFEGEVREADLDKTRFQLRTKDGVIRCVKPKMQTDEARKIFGRRIRARGKYETNREGKPRLLLVESIESMPETGRLEL